MGEGKTPREGKRSRSGQDQGALAGRKGPRAIRGDGEGRWGRSLKRIQELWERLLDSPAVWLVLFLGLGTWALTPSGPDRIGGVEPGTIADRDYLAPEDLLLRDDVTTRSRRDQARSEVPPIYDFAPGRRTLEEVRRLFAEGRRQLDEAAKEQAARPQPLLGAEDPAEADGDGGEAEDVGTIPATTPSLTDLFALRLGDPLLEALERQGFSEELEDRVVGVASQVLRSGVVASKALLLENRNTGIILRDLTTGEERPSGVFNCLGYPEDVMSLVGAEVRSWPGLTVVDRRELTSFLTENLTPNLTPNSSETLNRLQAAADAVSVAYNQIRQGQVIVRKGDQISPAAAEAINARAGGPVPSVLLPLLGLFLLLALSALVIWLGLRESPHEQERLAITQSHARRFGASLLLVLVAILGARLSCVIGEALAASFERPPFDSVRSYLYALPYASLALCSALLLGRQTAILLSAVFSFLVSQIVGGEDALSIVLYSVAGALAAIYAVDVYQVKQRMVMTRMGLVVSAVNVVMVLLLSALAGGLTGGLQQLGFDLLCAFASGLLVTAVASFLLPILESILGITTDIRLVELSNTNLPVLRRLAFEAPGSFQHSLMVANLAKQASEAIGADPALAYAGGLYHDIGKIYRAEYFIENQRTGQNPHDSLAPSMSTLILINHIKDGVSLARRHNLPQVIIDAIEQHHGTRLIKFFYNRALEQCDPATEEVREEKYRYPGPKPQNKVMGVLMLADAVEAASRTLIEPSATKIRTLIRTITEDCLRDGQLDETDLTLSDLNLISASFMRVLANIFHQRVDYPGFDFNRDRPPTADGLKVS